MNPSHINKMSRKLVVTEVLSQFQARALLEIAADTGNIAVAAWLLANYPQIPMSRALHLAKKAGNVDMTYFLAQNLSLRC